jgi:hypothetical protein
MVQSYLLTEENLVGTLADAILQLNSIKQGRTTKIDTTFFTNLIDFFDKATEHDFHNLLYERYFIVSEIFLNNIHHVLSQGSKQISEYSSIKKLLTEISQHPMDEIDEAIEKLKSLTMMLLKIKNQRQIDEE